MKLEWILGLCALLSVPLAVLVLFRRGTPWIWKVAVASVTAFYVLWFSDDVAIVLGVRQLPLRDTLPILGQTLLRVFGLILAVLWPLTLAGAAFQRARDAAAKKIQRLVILTALFWMALVIDVFVPPFAHNWIAVIEKSVSGFLKAAGDPPTQNR